MEEGWAVEMSLAMVKVKTVYQNTVKATAAWSRTVVGVEWVEAVGLKLGEIPKDRGYNLTPDWPKITRRS